MVGEVNSTDRESRPKATTWGRAWDGRGAGGVPVWGQCHTGNAPTCVGSGVSLSLRSLPAEEVHRFTPTPHPVKVLGCREFRGPN